MLQYTIRTILYVLIFALFMFLFNTVAISIENKLKLPHLSQRVCRLINSYHPNPQREAVDLVEKTIRFIKQYGPETAIPLINNNDGKRWYSGQFYVTVIDWRTKIIVASPARQALTGMYLGDIGVTLDGKSVLQIAHNIAKARGRGVWQSFYWRVPLSREVARYKSYGKLASTSNFVFVVMSGYYDSEGRCSSVNIRLK